MSKKASCVFVKQCLRRGGGTRSMFVLDVGSVGLSRLKPHWALRLRRCNMTKLFTRAKAFCEERKTCKHWMPGCKPFTSALREAWRPDLVWVQPADSNCQFEICLSICTGATCVIQVPAKTWTLIPGATNFIPVSLPNPHLAATSRMSACKWQIDKNESHTLDWENEQIID